ncbi:hypothetical protein IT418_00760 [bacterium]|nr:hypothetical protein [bacterium]
MDRITKRKTIQISGIFTPKKRSGDTIEPGEVIGTSRVPTLLETHPLDGGKVLVDDGVFATTKTPLIEYRRGFKKEVVGSTHEGIIRVTKTAVSLVADDTIEEIRAATWGRLVSATESSYVVDIKYLRMPIFVSKGHFVEAELLCLTDKGVVIAPHHITDEVREKIVLLHGAISKETYTEIANRGALGILAPSIDWNDYLTVFAKDGLNVGVLHGFGMFPLWRWYYHLLSKLNGVSVEVDFESSNVYVPVSDILMSSLEQDLMLFKEYWWGKQVKELQHESGDLIATLETGEQTPVMAEELFNIR